MGYFVALVCVAVLLYALIKLKDYSDRDIQ